MAQFLLTLIMTLTQWLLATGILAATGDPVAYEGKEGVVEAVVQVVLTGIDWVFGW